ncbi:hypothetical protein MRX96_003902 [Rhipicephalus microplus]
MPGTPTKKMKQSRLPFQALAGSAQKRKAAADQEPVCKQPRPDQPNPGQGTFRPFELKAGMTLAPAVPADVRQRFDHLLMDRFLQSQCDAEVRLNPRGERWHRYVREPRSAPRAKLLQFCENVRPAYWGTWRRRSRTVSGRNPWAKDQTLDYEVDSEAEWDEEPGESLSGSEPESEPDDYEVDNEVFVPHGYLSEDEEEGGGPSAAALQVRQLELQDELRESGPKGPRLQPLVVTGPDVGLLARFAAVRLKPGPLRPSWQEENVPDDAARADWCTDVPAAARGSWFVSSSPSGKARLCHVDSFLTPCKPWGPSASLGEETAGVCLPHLCCDLACHCHGLRVPWIVSGAERLGVKPRQSSHGSKDRR